MPTIKLPADVIKEVGTVTVQSQTKGISGSQGVMIIGNLISSGAPFQRDFPNMLVAQQWLSTGAAADVTVTRVEPVTFVA